MRLAFVAVACLVPSCSPVGSWGEKERERARPACVTPPQTEEPRVCVRSIAQPGRGRLYRVSQGPRGTRFKGPVELHAMSSDARYYVFSAGSWNDRVGPYGIYVHDLVRQETVLASVDSDGRCLAGIKRFERLLGDRFLIYSVDGTPDRRACRIRPGYFVYDPLEEKSYTEEEFVLMPPSNPENHHESYPLQAVTPDGRYCLYWSDEKLHWVDRVRASHERVRAFRKDREERLSFAWLSANGRFSGFTDTGWMRGPLMGDDSGAVTAPWTSNAMGGFLETTSPDGCYLRFVEGRAEWNGDGKMTVTTFSAAEASSSRTAEYQLAKPSRPGRVAFSGDGMSYAYLVAVAGDSDSWAELSVIDSRTGRSRQLSGFRAPFSGEPPLLSCDGSVVAFTTYSPDGQDALAYFVPEQ